MKFWDERICWSCCWCCCCSWRSCFCCSDKREDLEYKQQECVDVSPINLSNNFLQICWCHLSTYGLTLLGNGNPCARAWGLRGGGCGRKVGNVAWGALPKDEWMTPFRPPSTPFIFNWGIPVIDADIPLTVGREELLDWVGATTPSLKLRLRPLSRGWLKEAGLCCGGGVLWKEREELLRDGLPERSSWREIKTSDKWIVLHANQSGNLEKRSSMWRKICRKQLKLR